MRAAPAQIEDEERGLAALAPGRAVAGIEGLSDGAGILVDAVGLADHDAAERLARGVEQGGGLLHRHPVGMAKRIGPGAFDRLDVMGAQRLAGEGANAGPGGEGTEGAGEADIEIGDAQDVEPAISRPIAEEPRAFRPAGQHGRGGHAGDRGDSGQGGDERNDGAGSA